MPSAWPFSKEDIIDQKYFFGAMNNEKETHRNMTTEYATTLWYIQATISARISFFSGPIPYSSPVFDHMQYHFSSECHRQ